MATAAFLAIALLLWAPIGFATGPVPPVDPCSIDVEPYGTVPCRVAVPPLAISEAPTAKQCLEDLDSVCAEVKTSLKVGISDEGVNVDVAVSQDLDGEALARFQGPPTGWDHDVQAGVSDGFQGGEAPEVYVGAAETKAGAGPGGVWWNADPNDHGDGAFDVMVQSEFKNGALPLDGRDAEQPTPPDASPSDGGRPDETSVIVVEPVTKGPIENVDSSSSPPSSVFDADPPGVSGPAPSFGQNAFDVVPEPRPAGPGDSIWKAGLAVSLAVAGCSLAYWLLTVCVALFTRLRKNSLLEQKARGEVLDVLRGDPWATLRRLSEATGLARSTLRYHLRILRANGLISQQKPGKASRFAERTPGALVACEDPIRQFLHGELQQQARPLALVVRRLMDERRYSRSGAWRAIQAAKVKGVVDFERRGSKVWVGRASPDRPSPK